MKINKMQKVQTAFTRKLSKQYKLKTPKQSLPTKGFGEIMKGTKSTKEYKYKLDLNKVWSIA